MVAVARIQNLAAFCPLLGHLHSIIIKRARTSHNLNKQLYRIPLFKEIVLTCLKSG